MTSKFTAATVTHGSCSCGANTFEVKCGVGMQRFNRHCLYCQQFMGRPYTDVLFVRAKHVVIHRGARDVQEPQAAAPRLRPRPRLAVRPPRQGPLGEACPPDRGRWDNRGKPFIETIGGSAGMVFIPSANFEEQDALPPVQRHIYYRSREQDVYDDLPKHHYFAASQFANARMIGRVMDRG